jgi:hypothetical protein
MKIQKTFSSIIGLHHPLDGVTNPEYKWLPFIQLTKCFCKEKNALAFNRDRCCHLALCLWLILFHRKKFFKYHPCKLSRMTRHLKAIDLFLSNSQGGSNTSPHNEECHAVKGKQTRSCFLGTIEICQLFYWAAKIVTIKSIKSGF